MSNKVDLHVGRSVELLSRLKQAVQDFAQREEQLKKNITTRRNSATWKYREASEKAEGWLKSQLEQTETFFNSEEERMKAIYDGRRARIEKAQSRSVRSLQSRAKHAKEKKLSELQLRHLQAERSLPANLKAADAAAAEFDARLSEQRAALASAEARARSFFTGSSAFRKALKASEAVPVDIGNGSPESILESAQTSLSYAGGQLEAFRELLLPRILSYAPVALIVPLLLIAGGVLAFFLGVDSGAFHVTAAVLSLCVLIAVGLHFAGRRLSSPAAHEIALALRFAREFHKACITAAAAKHEQDRQDVQAEYERTYADINDQWSRAGEIETNFAERGRRKLSEQMIRVLAKNERMLGPRLKRIPPERTAQLAKISTEGEGRIRTLAESHQADMAVLDNEEQTRWAELEADWQRQIVPIYTAIEGIVDTTAAKFPGWTHDFVENWQPPREFAPATRFGQLELDLTKHPFPQDPRLSLPGPAHVSLPVALEFPRQGSLLFETNDSGDPTVIGTINNVILRLFATSPPGKLSFTIIDPVGLGQNFAGLMHLSDYEESLIDRRIWTQREQIDDRLAELNEHIEKVIQMYLRNEFATITEYNAQAGSVAEKYHFVVIADFPANFSETAAKRLQSIAVSGPRCGVFTLIHWDRRHPLPEGLVSDELRKNAVWIHREKNELVLTQEQAKAGISLVFDQPPDSALAATLIHKVGKSSIDSNRVEVPFKQVAPPPDEMWTNDTTNEVRVAIGRTGATKLQYLAIGKGTRQHALFAGKTGSGKSTLFHVIITNLALACSPDQVEFYLIDFKKGVEFKCYASKRLPHARVVAIESDREFGLSVLQRVDEELKRRGDMFRKLGVQDVAGYRRAGGTERLPRTLLIIDEFQEFFVDDDAVAQTASMLFDRIVRQGRAFGIHVLLGSQTLGGAYTLARATLGQMVIRVALQCNEADAYLIMDDNNPAPRLLSRPGEGIYNDAAGAVEGNNPFQVVWLSDEERDVWLDKVHELAAQRNDQHPSPIVFEGNAPAEVRENDLLRGALERTPVAVPAIARCWLGAPNSIKGPTEAAFQRQSGNHLLIVGQREEAALTMIGLCMIALAAQYPVGPAKFVLFHSATPGTRDADYLEQIVAAIPHGVTVAQGFDIGDVMDELAADLKNRSTGSDGAASEMATFVFIHGLQRFKKLRQEDEFSFSSSGSEGGNSGAQFADLISEGSSHGIHIITTVDTFNNVNRSMSRKSLSEFEMRVIFQMSANDSASLIDSPKASGLGLHRALLYNEHQGSLETFRPYAAPDQEWLSEATAKLARNRSLGSEVLQG